jgi:hypothetical protein
LAGERIGGPTSQENCSCAGRRASRFYLHETSRTDGILHDELVPKDLKIRVDPADFQRFVNNYRNTFRNKYRSPIAQQDTFHITYAQLTNQDNFELNILPKLWAFLGVEINVPMRTLKETVKQADINEDLSLVIENYKDLEFCFRHTDVLHFQQKRELASGKVAPTPQLTVVAAASDSVDDKNVATWSILLPICSRPLTSQAPPPHNLETTKEQFNTNRFLDLALSSQHNPNATVDEEACWKMLQEFADSLKNSASQEQLRLTEYIVGIDIDDQVFQSEEARQRISEMLPCVSNFVNIKPDMFGQICKIWNLLGRTAKHDYVVLLGDDVQLLDLNWQERIVQKFREIALTQGLPLGRCCCDERLVFPRLSYLSRCAPLAHKTLW